ncbi:hypothetical protein QNN00_18515 [Bacillus velezensis]|nr:hypothetical protein [Bacillus velezensis]
MPFALEELDVLNPCADDMWVHVTFSANNKAGDPIKKPILIYMTITAGFVCG